MSDDSTQRDEQHPAATASEERRDSAAPPLPWLDCAIEELFGAAPRRRGE